LSNLQEMRAVAHQCPEYVYIGDARAGLMAVMDESSNDVRCDTCVHWENNRCSIDMYDRVLTGLDQT